MTRYLNLGGNSNIASYSFGATSITVQFRTGRPYTYSYESAGQHNVEHMKILADSGRGLNSFIMRNVKYQYVR